MYGDSQPKWMQYLGAVVALVGVVGYVFFGWRFDSSVESLPSMVGAVVAVLVVAWLLYSRL
ncbi:hypothetical protein BRC81_08085 [Halobacteriales archaeon QS_1_68_20]|nr:MAG: hypothetical protein BRC81_08085 [Halobacteriales archaeon QS_1_68_20]